MRSWPKSQGGFWWAPIAAAAIGAGASKLAADEANKASERFRSEDIANQREFAQKGISWRVADAKSAGVHPLYAMGAQLPSFNPVGVFDRATPDYSGLAYGAAESYRQWKAERKAPKVDAPNDVMVQTKFGKLAEPDDPSPDVVTGPVTREEYGVLLNERNARLQGDLVQQQIEESRARLLSEQMRANQERHAAGGGDAVEYVPDEVIRGAAGTTAGTHQFWRRYDYGRGFEVVMPVNDEGPMSELPAWALPIIVSENVARYGPGWLENAKRYVPWLFGQ